jgi:hypothetical protein
MDNHRPCGARNPSVAYTSSFQMDPGDHTAMNNAMKGPEMRSWNRTRTIIIPLCQTAIRTNSVLQRGCQTRTTSVLYRMLHQNDLCATEGVSRRQNDLCATVDVLRPRTTSVLQRMFYEPDWPTNQNDLCATEDVLRPRTTSVLQRMFYEPDWPTNQNDRGATEDVSRTRTTSVLDRTHVPNLHIIMRPRLLEQMMAVTLRQLSASSSSILIWVSIWGFPCITEISVRKFLR